MGYGSQMQILTSPIQEPVVKMIGSESQAMGYGSKMPDSSPFAEETIVKMSWPRIRCQIQANCHAQFEKIKRLAACCSIALRCSSKIERI